MVFGQYKNLFYDCLKDNGHLKIYNSNSEKTAWYTEIDVGQFCLVNLISIKNKSNFKKTRFTNILAINK